MTTELKTILINYSDENILREREVDINTLSQEVQEVSEIFQDLAVLVQDQGEHIDNIETNIIQTNNYIKRGERQIIKASRYQKSSRKCICLGLCALSISLLIIFLISLIK